MSSNHEAIQILTPAGRMVGGDLFEGNTTDAKGNQLLVKSGPNIGQPYVSYYCGLAVPKTDPTVNELFATMTTAAKRAFPQMFDAAGNCIQPAFAWKYSDGDSQQPNSKMIKPCDREGYPGHWVFHFASTFAPRVYMRQNGSLVQIVDPKQVKRGDYIMVAGNINDNADPTKPGLYLNQSMIEHVGYGQEIITGPNPETAFGSTPHALPAGASATPLASTAPGPAGPATAAPGPAGPATAAPGPAGPATAAPGPAGPATAAPGPAGPAGNAPVPGQGPSAPATDYLNGPGAQSQQTIFTVNGAQYTAEQLRASGWTDVQIAGLTP